MGVRKLLNWIYERYQMPIHVAENGTTAKGEVAPTPEVLNDQFRIRFYEGYVGNALARAVKEDGVGIRSYSRGHSPTTGVSCCLIMASITDWIRMGRWLLRSIWKHVC